MSARATLLSNTDFLKSTLVIRLCIIGQDLPFYLRESWNIASFP